MHAHHSSYDTSQKDHCGSSTLSAHQFSPDGIDWHMVVPNVEPYGHTVQYDDGTSHTYVRPTLAHDVCRDVIFISTWALRTLAFNRTEPRSLVLTRLAACVSCVRSTCVCPSIFDFAHTEHACVNKGHSNITVNTQDRFDHCSC